MQQYDIVIVGSGIIGLTVANLLSRDTSYKIALVGSAFIPDNSSKLRVCAFNHTSIDLLNSINIMSDAVKDSSSFYSDVVVWMEHFTQKLRFNSAEMGYSNVGAVIPNHVIEAELWQNITSQISLYCPAEAIKFTYTGNKPVITLADDSQITAKLVLGADGRNSWLRQQLQIDTETYSYQQSAIVATMSSSASHKKTAWQRFLPTGQLALLPLVSEDKISIVWSVRTDLATKLMQLSTEDFAKQITIASDNVLGKLTLESKRGIYPLMAMHANSYIASAVTILGDAAHTIHPLAGQGVNAGILDAAVITQQISRYGLSQRALISYQNKRRGMNSALLFAMASLKRILMVNTPFSSIIGFSFALLNKSSFIKNMFTKIALGQLADIKKKSVKD